MGICVYDHLYSNVDFIWYLRMTLTFDINYVLSGWFADRFSALMPGYMYYRHEDCSYWKIDFNTPLTVVKLIHVKNPKINKRTAYSSSGHSSELAGFFTN